MLLTVPEDKPEGLTVDESSITDTEALLRFNAIDESPERIHGFFRGYRVRVQICTYKQTSRAIVLRTYSIFV